MRSLKWIYYMPLLIEVSSFVLCSNGCAAEGASSPDVTPRELGADSIALNTASMQLALQEAERSWSPDAPLAYGEAMKAFIRAFNNDRNITVDKAEVASRGLILALAKEANQSSEGWQQFMEMQFGLISPALNSLYAPSLQTDVAAWVRLRATFARAVMMESRRIQILIIPKFQKHDDARMDGVLARTPDPTRDAMWAQNHRINVQQRELRGLQKRLEREVLPALTKVYVISVVEWFEYNDLLILGGFDELVRQSCLTQLAKISAQEIPVLLKK